MGKLNLVFAEWYVLQSPEHNMIQRTKSVKLVEPVAVCMRKSTRLSSIVTYVDCHFSQREQITMQVLWKILNGDRSMYQYLKVCCVYSSWNIATNICDNPLMGPVKKRNKRPSYNNISYAYIFAYIIYTTIPASCSVASPYQAIDWHMLIFNFLIDHMFQNSLAFKNTLPKTANNNLWLSGYLNQKQSKVKGIKADNWNC